MPAVALDWTKVTPAQSAITFGAGELKGHAVGQIDPDRDSALLRRGAPEIRLGASPRDGADSLKNDCISRQQTANSLGDVLTG